MIANVRVIVNGSVDITLPLTFTGVVSGEDFIAVDVQLISGSTILYVQRFEIESCFERADRMVRFD